MDAVVLSDHRWGPDMAAPTPSRFQRNFGLGGKHGPVEGRPPRRDASPEEQPRQRALESRTADFNAKSEIQLKSRCWSCRRSTDRRIGRLIDRAQSYDMTTSFRPGSILAAAWSLRDCRGLVMLWSWHPGTAIVSRIPKQEHW